MEELIVKIGVAYCIVGIAVIVVLLFILIWICIKIFND